jgi:hypothetical protein
MIAARFSPGAISESSSSHLPPNVASWVAKPVTFPPGRSSRATMPLATGSPPFAKTIGIVRVSGWMATVARTPPASIMSGCEPTNSCASARIRMASSPPQRRSIRTLRPSVQPKVNAEMRGFGTGSFSSHGMSTPMRRIRSPCCARAASGQAAVPQRRVMNSRRRIIRSAHRRWHTRPAEWPASRVAARVRPAATLPCHRVQRMNSRRRRQSFICPSRRPWGALSGRIARRSLLAQEPEPCPEPAQRARGRGTRGPRRRLRTPVRLPSRGNPRLGEVVPISSAFPRPWRFPPRWQPEMAV